LQPAGPGSAKAVITGLPGTRPARYLYFFPRTMSSRTLPTFRATA
jgi:hypothetical protein